MVGWLAVKNNVEKSYFSNAARNPRLPKDFGDIFSSLYEIVFSKKADAVQHAGSFLPQRHQKTPVCRHVTTTPYCPKTFRLTCPRFHVC